MPKRKGIPANKCSDCGNPIKRGEPRFLVYKYQYVTELRARLCKTCANEEWMTKKERPKIA